LNAPRKQTRSEKKTTGIKSKDRADIPSDSLRRRKSSLKNNENVDSSKANVAAGTRAAELERTGNLATFQTQQTKVDSPPVGHHLEDRPVDSVPESKLNHNLPHMTGGSSRQGGRQGGDDNWKSLQKTAEEATELDGLLVNQAKPRNTNNSALPPAETTSTRTEEATLDVLSVLQEEMSEEVVSVDTHGERIEEGVLPSLPAEPSRFDALAVPHVEPGELNGYANQQANLRTHADLDGSQEGEKDLAEKLRTPDVPGVLLMQPNKEKAMLGTVGSATGELVPSPERPKGDDQGITPAEPRKTAVAVLPPAQPVTQSTRSDNLTVTPIHHRKSKEREIVLPVQKYQDNDQAKHPAEVRKSDAEGSRLRPKEIVANSLEETYIQLSQEDQTKKINEARGEHKAENPLQRSTARNGDNSISEKEPSTVRNVTGKQVASVMKGSMRISDLLTEDKKLTEKNHLTKGNQLTDENQLAEKNQLRGGELRVSRDPRLVVDVEDLRDMRPGESVQQYHHVPARLIGKDIA
jgi:propanediol dehydratase small subunit